VKDSHDLCVRVLLDERARRQAAPLAAPMAHEGGALGRLKS
jgi:hypothetical protein